MRILHVLDHGLPLHSGYAFRTRAIVKAQLARGWEVALSDRAAPAGAAGPDPEVVDGITFHRTPKPARGAGAARRMARDQRAVARGSTRWSRRGGPTMLHAHSPVLNALAALPVARRRGLPVGLRDPRLLGGCRGRQRHRPRRLGCATALTRLLETHAARQADAVAVICEGLRGGSDRARHRARTRSSSSPNGVDLDLFGSPPARRSRPSRAASVSTDADVVGFIGSFYDYEGLDDLIAAMPLLLAAPARRRSCCWSAAGRWRRR